MTRKILIVTCVWLLCSVVSSTAKAQNVTNVSAEQVGKNIVVSYDLDQTATISVCYSTDGGKTYSVPMKQVTGDVGRNVSAGHKSITWNVLDELDKLVAPNIVFKVVPRCEGNGIECGHQYVDLGLSVKWATCNIGASQPYYYGSYFAWGETNTKRSYSISTYKYLKKNIKSHTVLEPTNDAAVQRWGGKWRMPTYNEWLELKQNCNWEWTTINGYNGFKVTSKELGNTNSIFLPAGACIRGTKVAWSVGLIGFYWQSVSFGDENDVVVVRCDQSGIAFWPQEDRYLGCSIRPVIP